MFGTCKRYVYGLIYNPVMSKLLLQIHPAFPSFCSCICRNDSIVKFLPEANHHSPIGWVCLENAKDLSIMWCNKTSKKWSSESKCFCVKIRMSDGWIFGNFTSIYTKRLIKAAKNDSGRVNLLLSFKGCCYYNWLFNVIKRRPVLCFDQFSNS